MWFRRTNLRHRQTKITAFILFSDDTLDCRWLGLDSLTQIKRDIREYYLCDVYFRLYVETMLLHTSGKLDDPFRGA